MKKILILALALAAVITTAVSAQTFSPKYGHKIVLSGSGGDVANTLTLQTPVLTGGGYTLTFPASSTTGPLFNTAGALSWATPAALLTFMGMTGSTGLNSGDVTLGGENYLSLAGQMITANPIDLTGSNITGLLKAASFPALSGDLTSAGGTLSITVAKINGNTIPANAAGALINNGSGTLSWTSVPTGSGTVTGTNTGDVTLAGQNYLSLAGQVITANPVNLGNANVTGILLPANGGTGVNNGANTITVANNFSVPANAAGALINNGSGTLSWTSVPTGTGTVTGTNTGDQTITLTGPVTGSGTGTFATTITNGAVTYAKIQNVTANSVLLGSSTTGSGAPPSEIILGSGLSMTGSTLSATGTLSGGGTANTIPIWTSGTALGNSTITDAAGTLSTTENLTLSGANKVLTLTGNSTGVSSFTTGVQGATTYNYTLPITTPTANQVLTATAVSGASPFAVTLGWSNGGGGGLSGLTANGAMYATGATTAASTGAMTDGQLLVGKTGLAPVAATLTAGSNISITNGAGTITIASTASGTLSGMTANGAVYATGATTATSTGALTNGQLLIGSTGVAPVAASLTAGSNITITPGAGSITIASSNPVVFARKTADQILTASTVTLQADATLSVALVANATYEFSAVIAYDGTTSASDLKLGLAFSGTTTSIRWSAVQGGTAIAPSSVTAVTTAGLTGTAGTNIITPFTADATSTNDMTVFVSGVIVVGGLGGNLQFLESQATSQAATTTVLLGSHLKATRVQ